ncbi:unnamed protein product [Dicrocoelium dendriticum]|nr:unnamed protein product [Dicrocoelium dendriticum]
MWWLGLALFGLGEGANFAAYAMAPASLVTPLGGLSVLVSTVLSARFLDERLHLAGKLGCFICLAGSTIVVLHAPKEQAVDSLEEIQRKFFAPGFLAYGIFVLLMSLVLIFILGPRFGKSNPLTYLLISASLGSLSVMACKGLGIKIRDTLLHGTSSILFPWFFWFLLILLIAGISVQLYYLNRALDLFNTGLVTALLYVLFTAFVLTASAVLFREWSNILPMDYVELTLGLILISIGVFMMTVLKNSNFRFASLKLHMNTVPGKATKSPSNGVVPHVRSRPHSVNKSKMSPTRKRDTRNLLSSTSGESFTSSVPGTDSDSSPPQFLRKP